ncbi:hypothetical protein EYF80_041435 [Liparis tanakae]|uniref:Uncharacterized protein n=1 Tax=Liparis tanakae TaxID=230148 RepID=A0A4Z2G459_9TELE|nr:hypothetical protein EYF80_041435 [Liparis tanakae]
MGLLGSFVLMRKTSSESQREDDVYYRRVHYGRELPDASVRGLPGVLAVDGVLFEQQVDLVIFWVVALWNLMNAHKPGICNKEGHTFEVKYINLYLLRCLLAGRQETPADSLSISFDSINRKTPPQGALFIHATMFTESTQRTSWRFKRATQKSRRAKAQGAKEKQAAKT